MNDDEIKRRIAELEELDNGVHGELPLFPKEVAELESLKVIEKAKRGKLNAYQANNRCR